MHPPLSNSVRGLVLAVGISLTLPVPLLAQSTHELRFCYNVMSSRFVSDGPGGRFVLESRVKFGTSSLSDGVAIDVFHPDGTFDQSFGMSERAEGGHDGAGGLLAARAIGSDGLVLDAQRHPAYALPAYGFVRVDPAWAVPAYQADFVPAGSGESYVGSFGYDLRSRVFRRASNGAPAAGWTTAGRTAFANADTFFADLVVDHQDAVIVFGNRVGGLVMKRFLADGSPDPTWPTTDLLTANAKDVVGFPSGTGHLIAFSLQDVTPSRYRVLRLDPNGVRSPGWPALGLDFSDQIPFSDGAGGLFGLDLISGGARLRHVLADGSEPLGAAGVPVAPVGGGGVLGPSGDGGLFVVWRETREGIEHLRVRKLTAAGVTALAWPDSGAAATLGQEDRTVIAKAVRGDAAGGAIVIGMGIYTPCGFFCGLTHFASQVDPPDVLGAPRPFSTHLGLTLLGAHPVRGTLRLAIDPTSSSDAEVTLHDLAGRVLRRARVEGGARRELSWPLAGLPPGVMLARITQDGASVTRRVVVVD